MSDDTEVIGEETVSSPLRHLLNEFFEDPLYDELREVCLREKRAIVVLVPTTLEVLQKLPDGAAILSAFKSYPHEVFLDKLSDGPKKIVTECFAEGRNIVCIATIDGRIRFRAYPEPFLSPGGSA